MNTAEMLELDLFVSHGLGKLAGESLQECARRQIACGDSTSNNYDEAEMAEARTETYQERRARILALAKEWLQVNHLNAERYGQYLANFLELEFEKVAEAEREACLAVCLDVYRAQWTLESSVHDAWLCVKGIRQRGKR